MNPELKQEIHKLVDECKDDSLLQEVKVLLGNEKDLWDELTEEQQTELFKQISEPDEKDTLNYEEYLKATEKWRIK